MNYPQLFFYPHTIQEEFPYQVGSLCKIHLHNFENMEDKYRKIYSKLEAKLMISSKGSSINNLTMSNIEEEEEEEDPITILFDHSVSKNYLSSKIERLQKLFDWLNKQWIFSMKKMNNMTITYGRFPLIKIIFHCAEQNEDYCEYEPEETTNSFIDLFDFEKHLKESNTIYLNTGMNCTMDHEMQKKYNKTFLEKDRYDSDEYVHTFMSKEKIDAFLDEQKRKKYSIAHLWKQFWYEGIFREWFNRCPLLMKQTILLENAASENVTIDNKLWKVGGPLIAIGLATGGMMGISRFCIGNRFGKFF